MHRAMLLTGAVMSGPQSTIWRCNLCITMHTVRLHHLRRRSERSRCTPNSAATFWRPSSALITRQVSSGNSEQLRCLYCSRFAHYLAPYSASVQQNSKSTKPVFSVWCCKLSTSTSHDVHCLNACGRHIRAGTTIALVKAFALTRSRVGLP